MSSLNTWLAAHPTVAHLATAGITLLITYLAKAIPALGAAATVATGH